MPPGLPHKKTLEKKLDSMRLFSDLWLAKGFSASIIGLPIENYSPLTIVRRQTFHSFPLVCSQVRGQASTINRGGEYDEGGSYF